MTQQLEAHGTSTSMVKAALAELDAGADLALRVRVSCSSECSLQGCRVVIVDDQGAAVAEVELAEFDGAVYETAEFVVKAPFDPGEYTWTALFPAQDREGVSHEESSVVFSFIVKPHATGVEVWDVPSPIACGDEFGIRVGVKCSVGCRLEGQEIEIYDHEGARAATATLGEVSSSGGDELSCAEVDLGAPGVEGRYRWTARFPGPSLELPHEEASCTFAFGTVRQPEHTVTIEVVDKDGEAPVKNARVVLRPHVYRGSAYNLRTDDGGVARVSVAQGDYQLYVAGDEHEKLVPAVTVAGDVTIRAELSDPLNSWREIG